MIVNGKALIKAMPIKGMFGSKQTHGGVTHGLSEAGYDIRIKQEVRFSRNVWDRSQFVSEVKNDGIVTVKESRFALASAIEEFDMPDNLVGIVHDKSSWARRGLSVFNTVIESGWCGWLTLELVYHGDEELIIPAGSGIAQVVFHSTTDTATYAGRYQNQPDRPIEAIHAD